MENKSGKLLSPLMLFLASAIWGFAFVAQDAASEIPPFTLGLIRSVIAAIFLTAIIPVLDRVRNKGAKSSGYNGAKTRHGVLPNRHELLGGAIIGVILAVASFAQQAGISMGTDGGKAAFITALYVVLVPIYSLAMKKRAPLNVWISVGIAVIGFYLLCITEELSILPSDLPVIICALIFPFHILFIDLFSGRCDGVRMSAVQFWVASLVNLVFALVTEEPQPLALIFSNALPLLYLGIGSSGIAYTLQILGQGGTPPAASAIILSLESVFGAIGTALILDHTLSPREYLGCAIILIAVLLSQLDPIAIWRAHKASKEKQ